LMTLILKTRLSLSHLRTGARPFRAGHSLARQVLLNREPPALLVAEIKFRHGGGFGGLLIRRFNGPEVLPALTDDRDAPASQLGGRGFLFGGFHVASVLHGASAIDWEPLKTLGNNWCNMMRHGRPGKSTSH